MMLCKVDRNSKTKINDQIRKMLVDYILAQPVDTKIPPELELCKYFGVSRTTTNRIITSLVNDNYLYRERPLGTFTKTQVTKIKRIGIFFDPNAQILSKIVKLLSFQQEHNDSVLEFLPLTLLTPSSTPEERKIALRRIADKKLDVLVCYGQRWFPYLELEQIHKSFGQINFIALYQGNNIVPGINRIVFDTHRVGELAAQHLLNNGCKKFIFASFDLMSEDKIKFYGCSFPHYDMQIFEGFKKILLAAGKNMNDIKILNLFSKATEKDTSLVSRQANSGCGFFVLGDSRAKTIYGVAQKKGLQIGKDISIVGLFNTDWTEIFHPTLSSIDVNVDEMVSLLNSSINNKSRNLHLVVKPSLIVRES